MKTDETPGISEERMAVYRRTARRRMREKERRQAQRRDRAWSVARRAAELLKATHGAESVYLFGSLARGGPFDEHSDVDLAVRGLDDRIYYRVVSRLLDLDPTIDVDLIQLETAPDGLLRLIESEGERL